MAVKALLKETMNAHLESQREWVGHQNFPEGNSIEFNTSGGNGIAYTAPADGWVVTDIQVSNIANPEIIHCGVQASILNYFYGAAFRSSISVPVKKGELIHAYATNTVSANPTISMKLYPNLGSS